MSEESTFDEQEAMELVRTMFVDMSQEEFEARLQRAVPKTYKRLKREAERAAKARNGAGT